MRILLAILVMMFANGCTTIDMNNRVYGWPQLKEVIHVVSFGEMYSVCKKYSGFLDIPLGCSEIRFSPPRCDIWLMERHGLVEEHEHLHCLGYDHPDSDVMRDMLANWKKTNNQ